MDSQMIAKTNELHREIAAGLELLEPDLQQNPLETVEDVKEANRVYRSLEHDLRNDEKVEFLERLVAAPCDGESHPKVELIRKMNVYVENDMIAAYLEDTESPCQVCMKYLIKVLDPDTGIKEWFTQEPQKRELLQYAARNDFNIKTLHRKYLACSAYKTQKERRFLFERVCTHACGIKHSKSKSDMFELLEMYPTHISPQLRCLDCIQHIMENVLDPTLEFRFLVCHGRFNWASRLFRIRKVTLKESDLDVKHKEEENSDFHKLLNALRRRVPITMKNNACRFCNHNKNHPIQLE